MKCHLENQYAIRFLYIDETKKNINLISVYIHRIRFVSCFALSVKRGDLIKKNERNE